MYKNKFPFVVLIVIATACGAIKAPTGQVPRREEIETDAFGGWIHLNLLSKEESEGELIALSNDSIFVFNQKIVPIAKQDVATARLIMYNTDANRFATWTTLGSVGSISNGLFLIITLPAWIATGVSATTRESARVNYLDYPQTNWTRVNEFARFPQGFPVGLNRSELRARPKK